MQRLKKEEIVTVSEGASPEKGHVGEQAGGKGRSGCGFGHVDLEVVDFMQVTRGKGTVAG